MEQGPKGHRLGTDQKDSKGKLLKNCVHKHHEERLF